ncbi:glycerate kinase [Lactobacillus sp. PV037]|uniref:glycerate kinase family protein n=1 Tax=unclassified Lactobacillus TaxID=2620435 RepID=UPI00223F9AAC|nr:MULTISPECIES: glycerate kinase [unclassified Lactobacillus]QNQ81865.1 glycerate kinase [Lactobacillus sp. PV012]QNQ84096.1 glycerate kinase [Lactobacillus sp. PV037]
MKIIIAPDSFKGSLTADEVSQEIHTGLLRVFPHAKYQLIPMADGGEGTLEALVTATKGSFIKVKVHNPLHKITESYFGLTGDKQTAIIEMAQASGLQFVDKNTANPGFTSTYGTGELIAKALEYNPKNIIITMGGSSTNDAGAGMITALGAKLLDNNNMPVNLGGENLDLISKIDLTELDARLKKTNIILATDVQNPLTGKQGASLVFSKQKGASNSQAIMLDKKLHSFAQLSKQITGLDHEFTPGAGAAGGLGFAGLTFLNAKIESGIELVLKLTNFHQKAKDADLVFTGEGGIDFQTQFGKTPFGVAQAAKLASPNCTVIALAGNIGASVEVLYGDDKIDAIFATETGAKSLSQAIKDSKHDLRQTSENIARLIKRQQKRR